VFREEIVTQRFALIAGLLLALGFGFTQPAAADDYPSRPITYIVPWGPGGGADTLARLTSKLMEPQLKVSLPVINVPGATGQTGLTKLVTAPADGYTMAIITGDTAGLFASPNSHFKIDQFIPLGVMIQQPSGFYVAMNSPMKTWDDVVKASQQHELRVAVTGYGSPDAMTVDYFKSRGVKLQPVPFPEPGLRYSSIVGGQSDLLYEQAGDVRSFIDGKQIRPVMLFSKTPVTGFEQVPYSGKLGYNVTLTQFRVVVVRAGTDPKIVQKLSDALAKVATTKEYTDYLSQQYAIPTSFVPAKDAGPYIQKWLAEARALSAAGTGH
jgi:tripartite-type tricarboxylate transporter receptor subunit TctC